MKTNGRFIAMIICVLIGAVLFGLAFAGTLDEFWSGMGAGLMTVGVLRIVQHFRTRNNEAYREKVETDIADERNQFLRNKAWAWAGYLFIIIASVATIALKVLGQDQLSLAAGWAVCLMVILYWISFLILRKKY